MIFFTSAPAAETVPILELISNCEAAVTGAVKLNSKYELEALSEGFLGQFDTEFGEVILIASAQDTVAGHLDCQLSAGVPKVTGSDAVGPTWFDVAEIGQAWRNANLSSDTFEAPVSDQGPGYFLTRCNENDAVSLAFAAFLNPKIEAVLLGQENDGERQAALAVPVDEYWLFSFTAMSGVEDICALLESHASKDPE